MKYNNFGNQLRTERKKLGLTVQTLAEDCGVSRSYITLIENGMRLPGRKVIPRLASALQIKPVVMLNWYLENVSQKMHEDLKLSKP